MPAKSQAQQKFMAMVHAIQKGTFKGKASGRLREVASKMDPESVRHFAETKRKGLPEKKDSEKKASFSNAWLSGFFSEIMRQDLLGRARGRNF